METMMEDVQEDDMLPDAATLPSGLMREVRAG
jgi:hypothetical protein